MPIHTVTLDLASAYVLVHNTVFMYPGYTQTNTFREKTPKWLFTVNVTLLDQAKANIYSFIVFSGAALKIGNVRQ